MIFEFGGKTYAKQSEAFVAMYNAMKTEGKTDGRRTRDVANELGAYHFGWHPKTGGAYTEKLFSAIVAAIDGQRLTEFPCYIPTPALEAIEARAKATKKQFKDRTEWSRAMKREADLQAKFALLLHIGNTVQEAMEKHA